MMPHRRNSPAAERFAERRRREDEAPKLASQVPTLVSLRLEIEERAGSGATRYIRTFIVDHAPAIFLVPCGDPRCLDGGHDLTTEVLRALRARDVSFEVTDECPGSVGTNSSPCVRVVHVRGTAEYRKGSTPEHGTFRQGSSQLPQ
jgi:hypothetical protein